jgi:hypothetical protein
MMLAYTPLQIQTAYGYNNIIYGSVVGNGAGQTVAIIDPGDDANFVNSSSPNFSKSDLATFDADYGLPNPPSFNVIGEDGGARPTYANPADNPVDYGETSGDVEWVHALAPGANIVLIEETNNTGSDRSRALTIAVPASGATVVSMSSFGELEDEADTSMATSASVGITSATETGNTVTITTPTSLGVTDDSQVTIAGMSNGSYDGLFEITSVSSSGTTFKYTDPTAGLGSSTGGTATLPLFDNGDFTEPGVTYVASSGDRGAPGVYPANSPSVLAVGATDLEADSSGNYIAEAAWSNSSNIVSATESGDVVTITTENSTGPLVGNNITVANVGLAGYDGDFKISAVLSSTSFSYIDSHASNLLNSSGGTAISGAFSAAEQATELNPPVQIIDDSSGFGFSTTGSWTQSNAGGYDGENLTAAGGSSASATWTFDVPVGVKEGISLTWVAGAGNATNARYTINDGTDTFTETVDQKNAPNDNTGEAYAPSSTPFQEVAQEVISTTGVITVTLDASTANGTVSADAVLTSFDANPGGTGGGFSQYEPQPAYQAGLVIHNGNTIISSDGMRTTPDVSMIGGTGELVDTVNSGATLFAGTKSTFAGTSLSAPCWAALIADADQGRALSGLGSLTGLTQTLPMLYALPSYVFHDITTGFNGYNAGPGYDLVTGLGSPIANLVAAGLGGVVASGGFSVSAYKGVTSTSQTVATFENPGGFTPITKINWGDGTSSAGTIVGPGANGLYQLEGTHDYAKQGIYTITVTISFGPSTGATVTSTATVSYDVGILLLDRTGAGSLTSSGNGGISVTGGGDLIIDSNSSQAGIQSGNGTISAAVFDVTGKLVHSGSGGFVGPVQPEPSDSDPLATLAAPAATGPTFKNTTVNSKTATLSPGTYVGGIHITGNSKVTLLPGIYILQGGGLNVSGNSSLTGVGVTIYNSPATSADEINFSGSSLITLSAPTSGAYQGIVFFQNRASNAPVVLGSGSVMVNLTGVVYAPGAPVVTGGSANISIKGDAGTDLSGALIAYDLVKSGSGQLTVDASANTVSGSLPPLDV